MREAKPFWRDVPVLLRKQIESLMGSRIRTATRVFGGYGPSATFRIFLEDGRSVFAKGAGKGSNEENWRVVPLEEAIYREITAIQAVSPTYFGSVQMEGWHLLLLEDLQDTRKVPPWTEALAFQAVRGLAKFHLKGIAEAEKVPVMPATSLMDSWKNIRENATDKEYFLSLFQDERPIAEEWLHNAIDTLVEAATDMMNPHQPWGLIHTDLRSDNLCFRKGELVLFDWPCAARGPLICDLTFFAPSVAGEGGPTAEHLLREYKKVMGDSGVRFPDFAERAAAAATAGYFASRAGRPYVPALPRLRQIQRLQLVPALRWAATSLGLPQPPTIASDSLTDPSAATE